MTSRVAAGVGVVSCVPRAERLRREFVRTIVRGGWYGFARARETGVSPGHLGALLEDELGKVVDFLLDLAQKGGQLYCPACGNWWRPRDAVREGDSLKCPDCRCGLWADWCAGCGVPLGLHDGSRGVWVGGFLCCRGCASRVRRLLGGARG